MSPSTSSDNVNLDGEGADTTQRADEHLKSAREPPSLTAQRHSARDQSSRWLVPRGAASDGRSAGLPPGCSASRSPGAVPGSLAETGPRCRAAETRRPPPCPRPAADLKVRGTITSPSRRGVGRSASHRDDRPRTSRHDRQALQAGPAPERQRTFPTRTYLSHILLGIELRRMGEGYVHVGPHASSSALRIRPGVNHPGTPDVIEVHGRRGLDEPSPRAASSATPPDPPAADRTGARRDHRPRSA